MSDSFISYYQLYTGANRTSNCSNENGSIDGNMDDDDDDDNEEDKRDYTSIKLLHSEKCNNGVCTVCSLQAHHWN